VEAPAFTAGASTPKNLLFSPHFAIHTKPKPLASFAPNRCDQRNQR